MNIGVAAHITAAAPGGPRYDPQLTPSQRSALSNGIWLCQTCSRLIDADVIAYPCQRLLDWKASAEARAKDTIENPVPPGGRKDRPTLVLPSTDPKASWLAFSARSIEFVGRKGELRQLEEFLRSSEKFSWWVITGAGGMGKSRLALEFGHGIKGEWDVGFLSRGSSFSNWASFHPARQTLIIVDYVASRAGEVSNMVLSLAETAHTRARPVRVLLLERDLGTWWHTFLREESLSESAQMEKCLHYDPLELGGLSNHDMLELAGMVALSAGLPWTNDTKRDFESQISLMDPSRRPLFGMLAATGVSGAASNLLRMVLTKELARWGKAFVETAGLQRFENLVLLATLMGGISARSDGFHFLAAQEVASLLPNVDLLDGDVYLKLVGAASTEQSLAGLQPDILGERFVLDRTAGSHAIPQFRRLLLTAWDLHPDGLCDFIVRTSSDFPEEEEKVSKLFDLPLRSAASRVRWARLVADHIRVTRRSGSSLGQRLLNSLRELADSDKSDFHLQAECANAEFCLGNVLFFVESNSETALLQYTAAIARAPHSAAAAGAMNNRGIVRNMANEQAQAFDDWTANIANSGIPDEARACSLNNRADIFAARQDHPAAIADRSAVLALRDTSPDRRYIALFRRCLSYLEMDQSGKALKDLDLILATDDISTEQKCEAQVQRGFLLLELSELGKARQDFDTVLASEHLFAGTGPHALVGLAELARIEGEQDRASQYLVEATAAPDVRGSTMVQAIITTARLLDDDGQTDEAVSMWNRVLLHPRATVRQRKAATSRLAT